MMQSYGVRGVWTVSHGVNEEVVRGSPGQDGVEQLEAEPQGR